MSVHEDLRTLVTRYGDRILDTADDLRATLDDFLEEGQASPGEINLLVDAVRLGAYEQLLSMLAHGADPRTAVEGAGSRLAEERGGDQRSASWACAALGYAVGRVPEAAVLAYRAQPPQGGVAAPAPVTGPAHYGGVTAPPPGFSAAPPPTQPSPPGHPYATPPAATQGPAYTGASAGVGVTGDAWNAPPAGRTGGAGGRRNLLIGAGAAVAAVVVIGVVAVVTTGDGGDREQTTTSTPAEETVDPDVSADDLVAGYSALGTQVDSGADECERAEPQEGQAELVRCTYSQLEVLYTTYVDEGALDEARSGIDEEASSQTYELDSENATDAGHFRLLSDPALDETWMYWDSTDALQSAYVSDTTSELPSRAAQTFFDQRGQADASRVFPEPVAPFESPALWEMAQDYVGDQVKGSSVTDCQTSKLYDGDVEGVRCVDGDYTLFFYVRESPESLQEERDNVGEDAQSDTTWNWFRGEESSYPTSGRLIKTTVEGQAVVYWDDTALQVTGYIYGPTSRMKPVVTYWSNGE